MTDRRVRLGRLGESIAASHLKNKGMTVQTKNWRSRYGEIDLIVRDGAFIVFVEVRLKRSSRYGRALESVDANKQRRIRTIAELYLTKKRLHGTPVRFDVVGIDWEEGEKPIVHHIENAF